MTRMLYLFICLSFCSATASGQYTRKQIFDLAQSHVQQFLGPTLAGCARITEGIRYSYRDENSKLQYEDLDVEDIVRGKVERIYVFYGFQYAYPGYRDTIITQNFNIEFDHLLQLVKKPDLSFIPDYVWAAKNDEFVGWDKAKDIAGQYGLPAEPPPGKHITQSLLHSRKNKQFTYVIDLATEPFGDHVVHEVWFIDAVNGALLHHESGPRAMELFLSMTE